MRRSLSSVALVLLVLTSGCIHWEPTPPAPPMPVLTELTATDCSVCQAIHMRLQDLKPQYEEAVTFMTIDVSNAYELRLATDFARDYNAHFFIKRYQDAPGTVGIINARNGRKMGMLQNEANRTKLKTLLDEAVLQMPEDMRPLEVKDGQAVL